MKMRSFLLAALFTASSFCAFAQKGEVNTAKSSYDRFLVLKDANSMMLATPSLKAAKTAIDKAVVHEKTKADATAWTYKALIYGQLAVLDTVESSSSALMSEAVKAQKQASTLDTDGANKTLLAGLDALIGQHEVNAGVQAYQAKEFEKAFTAFNNALNYRQGDTTITYYAGLSAINAKNYDEGIKKYEQLTKTSFSANPSIYLDLSRLYSMKGDTAKAIQFAAEGAAKYNDSQLATQEIELSLMQGKEKEMIEKISAQAQKDPKNKLYPYYLGIAYSTSGDAAKAEEAYLKAIAIDPNFADATVNLAGVKLNKGIAIYNEANKLPQSKQKEYEAMIKQSTSLFDEAFPYLEKAAQLDGKSRIALENLKTYYLVKKNQAKIDEINKKLETL